MESSQFDALVAGFYRAATCETSWEQALGDVQEVLGARACVLQTVDMASGRMLGIHNGGPDVHEATLSYVRQYHAMDPRRRHALSQGVEGLNRWNHCHEVFDDAFVAGDPFYRHYLPAYGIRYNSSVAYGLDDGLVTGFILELPASRGVLTPDERQTVQRLGSHMHDALRAHQKVRKMAAQALAGHALLSSFPMAMWLIDWDRYIHFRNAPAEAETAEETRMAQRGAHLVLKRNSQDRALAEQLERLRQSTHGTTALVDLRSSRSAPPTWLYLSSMKPEAVLGAFGDRPLVLAILFDPAQIRALDPFALSHLLKLSPAEGQVAARLGDGATPQQIADEGGTSITTVRTHIRSVLMHFGLSKVTQLVSVLRQGEALWAQPAAHR